MVVLLTDDEQYDSIRCMGNSIINTPNLDRVSTNGMIFRNAHIMGGWAEAVCLPSRTMIMTGRTLWDVPGLTGNNYPANIANQTIPITFSNAGYSTMRSGKQGNTYLPACVRFELCDYYDIRDATASSHYVNVALNWIHEPGGGGHDQSHAHLAGL